MYTKNMLLRKYKPKNKEQLIALWQRCFPNNAPHNEPTIVLQAKLKVDDLVFIAEEKDKIIGACMAGYDGHRGWLYAVAILPEYRRKGVGSKLVKYVLSELKKLGCIKVNLQIRSTNKEVAQFYRSIGFVIEDRLSMGTFIYRKEEII